MDKYGYLLDTDLKIWVPLNMGTSIICNIPFWKKLLAGFLLASYLMD